MIAKVRGSPMSVGDLSMRCNEASSRPTWMIQETGPIAAGGSREPCVRSQFLKRRHGHDGARTAIDRLVNRIAKESRCWLRRVAQYSRSLAFLYAALCAVFWLDAPFFAHVPSVPRWLGVIVVSAIGPAILLADGFNELFIGSVVGISACLALAWGAWRQWPDSEVFAAFLLVAAGIWAASGWLAVAALV